MWAEGIDVGAPDSTLAPAYPLNVFVVGGLASFVFNLPGGLAGYAISVRLISRHSELILSEDYEVATDFDDRIISEVFDRRSSLCTLGRCTYPAAEILS